MERLITWARENPQFAALGFVGLVLVIVMTVIGTAMVRAGASLKPLVWFLVFFGLVGGPQGIIHFIDGLAIRRARLAAQAGSSTAATVSASSVPALVPVPWAAVFGPGADPALITDAKQSLTAALADAEEAKLSFNVDGSSALAARFPSINAAAKALNRYGTFFNFSGARGSDEAGWIARRHGGQGEWVHVVTAGPELYAWTAATEAAVLEARTRALGPWRDAPPGVAVAAGPAPDLLTTRLRARPGLMSIFVVVNLVLCVGWFFKGSSWAARVPAVTTAKSVTADGLRQALLALNTPDRPTDVTVRPDGAIEVNWRYADARWFDLMRVHQMKRTQRLVLHPDEATRTVRVREYWSAFDASAGARDLRLNWVTGSGIQFFAIEHTRVLGVQLDASGRPTSELSRAYTFNLQTLKAPFIAAVTQAGWRWQPVVWNGPESLRWITE